MSTDPSQRFGALDDITVLDLTQMLAGPYGTMMLADHGADVIKIEPFGGDVTRGAAASPSHGGSSLGAYFQSVNRNKRSVCLDLKRPEGRDAFKRLVAGADAVVENFRAEVMDRLGLGYEALRQINPRLVYGTLRGFGDPRTGASPYARWPAFDVVAQAMGGVMAITGPDPMTPTKVGPGIGDIIPGIMLAFGVVSAIHHARRTGVGQFVDISMVDSIFAVCERMVWQHSAEGTVPGPEGNHHPFLCPFGMFPASDGHVTIAAHTDDFFAVLCAKLDMADVAGDMRFTDKGGRTRDRRELIVAISRHTARHSKAELTARLGGRIPYGPVMNIADIADDPHFAAREMIVTLEQPNGRPVQVAGVPLKMTATPGGVRRRSPFLGEDTVPVLRAAGLTDQAIAALVKSGAALTGAGEARAAE
ncbi:CaiB/BaiF CoA transferase family protein [Chelatococcus reniformis]|uniref:CoA transferase n=1 Tax=Chelatococcus reniformis TaxID=1494448 RepID=A0A916XEW9_9HYPH|nr:CoA transferase [Chelatococcus reniformis]GGC65506.1 CoA transferase [Chelatococcus reniformis]